MRSLPARARAATRPLRPPPRRHRRRRSRVPVSAISAASESAFASRSGAPGLAGSAVGGGGGSASASVALTSGGGALKKHSLLKAEDVLAALHHVARPPPAARAALLLLLGRIRREMLPAFAPPDVLRACSCVVCCVLCAVCTRPHTRRDCIRSLAKSREIDLPFTQGQSRRPNLSEGSVASDPGRPQVVALVSTRTAGRPLVDPHRGSALGRPTVGRSECESKGPPCSRPNSRADSRSLFRKLPLCLAWLGFSLGRYPPTERRSRPWVDFACRVL